MDTILQSLRGLDNFALYFFSSLLLILVFKFLYALVTPHDEWKLVKEDKNTAASIGFIGAVIGPGGKIIQEIQRETGATINLEEKNEMGEVSIFSANKDGVEKAVAWIKGIVAVPEVGDVYELHKISFCSFRNEPP